MGTGQCFHAGVEEGNGEGDHFLGVRLVVEGAGHAGGDCHVDLW